MIEYTQACLSQHLGLWCVEDRWAAGFMSLLSLPSANWPKIEAQAPSGPSHRRRYALHGSTAIIPFVGHMTKGGDPKFGGVSTVDTIRALQMAGRDDEVERIALFIESPGGHLAGTQQLANTFRAVGEVKSTVAHIEDLGASAAYYVASQAQRISANPPAMVGNIGVRGQIVDTSKQADMLGLKFHVLSSGPFKAVGAPGTVITDEHVAEYQRLIDQSAKQFFEAVQRGRGLSEEQLAAVADGRIHIAEEALELGLIDEVSDFETVLNGGDSMDAETLAVAMVKALADAGVVQASAPDPDPVPVKMPERVEYENVDTAPTQAAVVPTEADLQQQYEIGVTEGRGQALAIFEQCLVAYRGDAQAIVNNTMSALKTGESLASLRQRHADEAAQASESAGEINATPPVKTGPIEIKAVTPEDIAKHRAQRAGLAG